MARLNLRWYLEIQGQERYRAFIIHAPAMAGKTALAQRMHEVLGTHVLDLQAYFLRHLELAKAIDRFRPNDLTELLLDIDVPEHIIVVDNIDFLLNTWPNRYLEAIVDIVDRGLKSPDTTDKTFVFVVQTNPIFLRRELTNSRHQPRIFHLDAFYAL